MDDIATEPVDGRFWDEGKAFYLPLYMIAGCPPPPPPPSRKYDSVHDKLEAAQPML